MKTNSFSGIIIVPQTNKVELSQMSSNEITVLCRESSRSHKSAYSITFSQSLHELLSKFKYCALYKSRITNKLLLVFNNEDGFPVHKREKRNNIVVHGKELLLTLCEYINRKEGLPFRCFISDNLYNGDEYATFEILKSANK